ncbi:hypothetical protein ACLMJK_001974 [Lecanora helva]
MLPLTYILAAVLALVQAASAATISFHNLSPDPICYKVETTSGNIPTNSLCDYAPGIFVNATQNLTLNTTLDFNGAITAMRMDGFKGSRHEVNFQPGPDGTGVTWYDIDYEMGMSNSTLGPVDHRNRTNGLSSLAGEQNCLAKANDAWVQLEDKSDLIPHYYYLDSRYGDNLTTIRMDKKAPIEVQEFLQLTAGLNGYIGPGSVIDINVDPDSRAGKMVSSADLKTFVVDTQDMEIIAY